MVYQFKFREFAEALYEALRTDPFYMTMENTVEGDIGQRREAMVKYLDYSMVEAEHCGKLFIPSSHNYGVSVWSIPIGKDMDSEKKENKKRFLEKHMGQASLDTYLKITSFMSMKARDLIDPNAWYLSIVGIKPDFQGQGLGGGLVKEILSHTDSAKTPTYLETFTPQNMSFYERLGYKETGSFYEPTVKSKYWIMLRNPR